MENYLDKLKEIINGKTVVDVLPLEAGEGVFTLSVKSGKKTLNIPIYANDMGWWLGSVQVIVEGLPESEHVFNTVEDMLNDMAADIPALSGLEVEPPPCPWESVTHPETLRLGYRCNITGKTRWCHLVAVKISSHAKDFTTDQVRNKLAQAIWERGYIL
jgi:hypothetical protein